MTLRWFVPTLMIVAVLAGVVWSAVDDPVAADMEQGAQRFLRALDAGKRAQATIAFSDEERYNFHYIPRERQGIPYKSMTPAERKLSHSLLATGVSHHGFGRALGIMYLDQILFEIENNARRDADAYYVTVFGEPTAGADWGWRVEGHHLSLNFTLRDGRVVSSFPSFLGRESCDRSFRATEGDARSCRRGALRARRCCTLSMNAAQSSSKLTHHETSSPRPSVASTSALPRVSRLRPWVSSRRRRWRSSSSSMPIGYVPSSPRRRCGKYTKPVSTGFTSRGREAPTWASRTTTASMGRHFSSSTTTPKTTPTTFTRCGAILPGTGATRTRYPITMRGAVITNRPSAISHRPLSASTETGVVGSQRHRHSRARGFPRRDLLMADGGFA